MACCLVQNLSGFSGRKKTIADETVVDVLGSQKLLPDGKTAKKTVDTRKMGRFWCKLKATLWKCYQVRKRHWILTLLVILLPITLFGLLGFARSKISSIGKQYVNETTYNEILWEEVIYEKYKFDLHDTNLLYAPNTSFINELMQAVRLRLGLMNNGIKDFESESELLAYYQSTDSKVTYAVVFYDVPKDGAPAKLKYDVRNYEDYLDWQTDELFQAYMQYMQGIGSEKYFTKAFVPLQMAIDTNYIRMRNRTARFQLAMQEFPYPPHVEDMGLNEMFMHMLPFVTLFSFMLLCPATLKRVVEEKETGIKELMKMMGLPTSYMWFGWFLDALVVNVVSIVFIVVLMKIDWGTDTVPIEYCNGFVLFLFLVLYCSACIALCFVVSTMFNSPNFTTVFGILLWIVSYIIPYSLGDAMAYMSLDLKLLLCLFPNVAMHYAYQAVAVYEIRGLGVQWSNLFVSASGGMNDVTMGLVLIMLLVDTVVFLLVTFYVDTVRPGNHGLGKRWSFPITGVARWLKEKFASKTTSRIESLPTNEYEKIEACALTPGIKIRNLMKNYGNQVAVNNLSIDFFKGEITVLLGHNGAGKTTTMSILTGMIKATSGDVYIGTYDIKRDLDRIRTLIGICPQHNLVFPDLTVEEHLQFFAMLNDVPNAGESIDEMLGRLNLLDKRRLLPSKLSGGMKRKLCLGMSMISNPEVLILDEPTSGLDPKSRREIWDVLLKWRNDNSGRRTILISTHFMEEADVLGDRIAIMDHGTRIAYGTPMFLKKEYSTGYVLTVIKQKKKGDGDEEITRLVKENIEGDEEITRLVKENIEGAKAKIAMQNVRTFSLPNEEKQRFPELIKQLELSKEELGIDSIGISITTLEDVFLKISKHVERDETDDEISIKSCPPGTPPIIGQKFCILFRNHWNSSLKLWPKYTLYIGICLVIVLATLLLSMPTMFSFMKHEAMFDMRLNKYGQTFVYYGRTNGNDEAYQMSKHYADVVGSQGGNAIVSPSVSAGLIDLGKDNIEKYKQHAIIAAEFNYTSSDGNVVNAMYSNLALHGAPISLNLAANAIAKTIVDPSVDIEMRNVPLPKKNTENYKQQSEVRIGLLWMLLFPMGILFLSGSFVIYPYQERNSNLKHLLYMTGVKSFCYWFQMLLFDLVFYAAIIVAIVLLVLMTQNPIFANASAIGPLICILLLYGVTAIPYVYLFSYRKTVASAFGLLVMLNLFTGVVLTVVVVVLKMSGEEYYENMGDVLHVLFCASPQYWLTYYLMQFTRRAVWNYNWEIMDEVKRAVKCRFDENPCCFGTKQECDAYKSFYTEGMSPGYLCLYTVVVSLVYFLLLLFSDSVLFKRIRELKLTSGKSRRSGPTDDLFDANDLRKSFGGKPVVNGVNFQVKQGFCYGLLGVNGAGKTTTFKMLTGDTLPNDGTATIKRGKLKYDLSDNRDDYLSNIGYCPQFNAVNEILTGRELLTLFAQLRGLNGQTAQEVDQLITALDLTDYADMPCGKYSGGNKRKLCLGISLIASPTVIMLDEPTSGVDPASRRKLWDVMKSVKKSCRQSIVLTSHSMDECEALCDDLAIMKAGQVECQDNIPNLKMTYGKGFTVLVKVRKSEDCVDSPSGDAGMSVDRIEEKFMGLFDGKPDLKDKHMSLLHFYVPKSFKLSEIFEKMERFQAESDGAVEDYTVNMATLEDVFLAVSDRVDSAGNDTAPPFYKKLCCYGSNDV